MIYHHIGSHRKETHYEDTSYIYVSYILFEDSELPMSTTIPVKAELLRSKLFQDTYVVVQIPSVIFYSGLWRSYMRKLVDPMIANLSERPGRS